MGIAIAAISVLMMFVGSALTGTGVTLALLGGALAYFGAYSRRQTEAVLLNNAAFDLVSRGRIAEAEALLDAVSMKGGNVRRAVAIQRAIIALRRADAPAAEEHANVVLAAPLHLLTREAELMQNTMGLAIRAVARASSGKEADALEDIRAVRASDMATPEALGRAAVAEAIVAAKNDDREVLARVLSTTTPLFDYVAPRERALLRAFRRMIEVRGRSVYREPARPLEPSREEPLLGEWVSKIVPQAAAFVPEAEMLTESPALNATLPAGSPANAGSQTIAQQASRRSGMARIGAVLALWVLLVGLFLVIWQFLTPAPTPERSHEVVANPDDFELSLLQVLIPSVVVLLLAAILVGAQVLKARRGSAAVRRAMRALVTGDREGGTRIFSELVTHKVDAIAASAQLQLGVLAERAVAMNDALARCDAGLARVSRTAQGRALQSDILVPELVAERAFVLAALGDAHQANAELATLAREHPTFAFMTRSVFRVRLLQALRGEDLEAAVRLARERTPELPLSRRDEMLADIVLVLSGGKLVEGEAERITSELSEDGELAAWVDFMAPNARALLAARSQARTA
jgi:hypothetical protein